MNSAPEMTSPATMQKRSGMVDLNGAAFLRGVNTRRIELLVDGGTLLEPGLCWVWNVATDPAGKERCLRFWFREIAMPDTCAGLKLGRVLSLLLGEQRREFPTGLVCEILLLRYKHLQQLKLSGALPGNESTPRAALEKFLTDRLVNK